MLHYQSSTVCRAYATITNTWTAQGEVQLKLVVFLQILSSRQLDMCDNTLLPLHYLPQHPEMRYQHMAACTTLQEGHHKGDRRQAFMTLHCLRARSVSTA
jgi:hypothetical protein